MLISSSAPFRVCPLNGCRVCLPGDRIPNFVKATNPECLSLLALRLKEAEGQAGRECTPHLPRAECPCSARWALGAPISPAGHPPWRVAVKVPPTFNVCTWEFTQD